MAKKIKLDEIQKSRLLVQLTFVLLSIWIGIEFYFFVSFLESGNLVNYVVKPGGVEAFLPISSLMSFYYFVLTGVVNSSHPAGLFIFLSVVTISLVYGKSFCSYVCPIGFISEYIGEFGEKIKKKIFKKPLRKLPRILDYPLRSLKYLLLFFFAWGIFSMTDEALELFLDSPYNKIADVKMWYFFAEITQFSLIVITILFLLSIVIRNFWCRYLCPYGALLGIASLLSLNKIKREKSTCIDCKLCTKACPSSIQVHKVNYVISDECTSCMSCVSACPVENTLFIQNIITKKKPGKYTVPVFILSLFLIVNLGARISGNWFSNISPKEYLLLYEGIDTYDHIRSVEDVEKLNKVAEKNKNVNKESKSLNNKQTNKESV